jgi:GNAT superfamily N-acetyltransferase
MPTMTEAVIAPASASPAAAAPASADTSEAALIALNEANMCAAYESFGSWTGGAVTSTPNLLVSLTGVLHPILNGVFRPRLAPDQADAAIQRVVDAARARDVPLLWWVGPEVQPDDLPRRLEAHGIVDDEGVPGMVAPLSAVPAPAAVAAPGGLTIERVAGTAALKEYVDVLTESFHMPPEVGRATLAGMASLPFAADQRWRHYLARLDGAAVATASILLAAGVAGVYCVATLPPARGRGVASHLLATALHEACAAGYEVAALQSSEMGFRVYQRLGFHQCCYFRHFLLQR